MWEVCALRYTLPAVHNINPKITQKAPPTPYNSLLAISFDELSLTNCWVAAVHKTHAKNVNA